MTELEITDIAFGGDGVARQNGAVYFVPFTALGDRIQARVVQESKNFRRAEIVSILEPGPGRTEPPCPYYGNCGGCQYQHVDYPTELAAKSKQVRDTLVRLGKIEDPNVLPIIRSPEPYGYRNRITVHCEQSRVGFRARDGRTLVDVERCALASDEVNAKLKKLRASNHPREHYSVRADDVRGEIFYQTNRFMLDVLKEQILAALSPDMASAVEGYCGIGFFTQPLAAKVQKICGIESNERSVEVAKREAPANAVIFEGTCEQHLPVAREEAGAGPCACVMDPPREGLSARVKDDLKMLDFQQLIYLSCNPATLARDLRDLSSVWKPVSFQPIDLFPQTAHIECLAVCERVKP